MPDETLSVDAQGMATLKIRSFSSKKFTLFKGPKAAYRAAKMKAASIKKSAKEFTKKALDWVADADGIEGVIVKGAIVGAAVVAAVALTPFAAPAVAVSAAAGGGTAGITAVASAVVAGELAAGAAAAAAVKVGCLVCVANPGVVQEQARKLSKWLGDDEATIQGAIVDNLAEFGVPALRPILEKHVKECGLEWKDVEMLLIRVAKKLSQHQQAIENPKEFFEQLVSDEAELFTKIVLTKVQPSLEPLTEKAGIAWEQVETLLRQLLETGNGVAGMRDMLAQAVDDPAGLLAKLRAQPLLADLPLIKEGPERIGAFTKDLGLQKYNAILREEGFTVLQDLVDATVPALSALAEKAGMMEAERERFLSALRERAEPGPVPGSLETLKEELAGLSIGALNRKARELGVDVDAMDDAADTDDPKAALIALIVAASPGAEPAVHTDPMDALKEELAGLKISALNRKARELGVDVDAMDDAADTDDPRAALIALIITATTDIAAAQQVDKEYRVKLKGTGKVTVQLSAMGVQVTMKKGKPPTTFLYQTLQSWGPNDKGFEMTPSEGKAMNFECDDSDAQALTDGMTAKAKALAKAQKEAKKAAQEASTPEGADSDEDGDEDKPEFEEDADEMVGRRYKAVANGAIRAEFDIGSEKLGKLRK
eukprot:COSAG06_NODE_5002_length_3796_cov_33.444414_1_plen_655_part_10